MHRPEVTVIDYGVGNLLSVQRGLEHCGAIVSLTSDPEYILDAKRVVLPGVGAFGNAMQALQQLHLDDVIKELVERQTPLLGICLGMQLLMDDSEEFGVTSGLGLISGRVIPVPTQTKSGEPLKIPHIGWSGLQPSDVSRAWCKTVLEKNEPGDAAYFVHSYMAVPKESENRIANCLYGGHLIPAVIGKGSVIGCQFHPEKSGDVGLRVLEKYLTM